MKVAFNTLGYVPKTQRYLNARDVKKTNTIQAQFDVNSLRPLNFSRALTFTGNTSKNLGQIISVAPEYQGLLNGVYKVGGLANVTSEASAAFKKHKNIDARAILPYHAPENPQGKIKIKSIIHNEDGSTKMWTKAETGFAHDIEAYEFIPVDLDQPLQEGQQYVIHETIDAKQPWKTPYKIIEPVKSQGKNIEGKVYSISQNLDSVDEVPYHLFKVRKDQLNGGPDVYIMHTPELAKFEKAYTYKGDCFSDLFYGNFSRAVTDALPKLVDENGENFNPGTVWLHDRQVFPTICASTEESAKGNEYWRGIMTHSTFHNPGRNYQGHYMSPMDFVRITCSPDDLKIMQSDPEWDSISEIIKKVVPGDKEKGVQSLPKDEFKKLQEFFKPYIGDFVDEYGDYNMTTIPIINSQLIRNGECSTIGSVSDNFGKEMSQLQTCEISDGLTRKIMPVRSYDIVNGSTPASLKLDEVDEFCPGFTDEIKKGFTPILPKTGEINFDTLNSAKQSNKQWLINTIADASPKVPADLTGEALESAKAAARDQQLSGINNPLNELFFGKAGVEKLASTKAAFEEANAKVLAAGDAVTDKLKGALIEARKKYEETPRTLGSFSKFEQGDILFFGWGRADSQKGFPTSIESFKQYLKNMIARGDEESLNQARHTKILLGAGPWDEGAKDWESIKEGIKEIADMGYGGNIVYVDGRSSNRFVSCIDYSIITSRYEPCGITPLESFAGGTPVLSNATGGSPDFIKTLAQDGSVGEATGFLTDTAFMISREEILKRFANDADFDFLKNADPKAENYADILDKARVIALAKQEAQNIDKAVKLATNEPDKYKQMVQNAIKLKIDWHENGAFNGGLPALDRYMNVFQIEQAADGSFVEMKSAVGRSKEPMKKWNGTFVAKMAESVPVVIKQNKLAFAALGLAGGALIGFGAKLIFDKVKGKNGKNTSIPTQNPAQGTKLDTGSTALLSAPTTLKPAKGDPLSLDSFIKSNAR